jgi:hypothetical protein
MTKPCFLPACRLVTFASSALEAAYAYVSGLGSWVQGLRSLMVSQSHV